MLLSSPRPTGVQERRLPSSVTGGTPFVVAGSRPGGRARPRRPQTPRSRAPRPAFPIGRTACAITRAVSRVLAMPAERELIATLIARGEWVPPQQRASAAPPTRTASSEAETFQIAASRHFDRRKRRMGSDKSRQDLRWRLATRDQVSRRQAGRRDQRRRHRRHGRRHVARARRDHRGRRPRAPHWSRTISTSAPGASTSVAVAAYRTARSTRSSGP